MTVRELIEKLRAMPQDALVVRQLDEFSTLVDLDPGVGGVTLYRVGEKGFGDYARAEECGPIDGWHDPEGEPFEAVEIGSSKKAAP